MTSPSKLHPFERKLAETWPPAAWRDLNVLLAVSGGPDSMALLRATNALKSCGQGRLVVAHFNHRLRGEAADADQAFVVQVARELNLPLEVGFLPEGAARRFGKHGLEGGARRARYRFLTETASKLGARLVAVAHTADDQAETILHRILRGTGIGGLAGMRRVRPLSDAATLIRPLLPFRRAEVHAYLHDLGQNYRLDATNLDERRTRNRIRHHLLPELAHRFNPNVVEALLRLGNLAAEVQSVIAPLVDHGIEQCLVKSTADEICLDFSRCTRESPYVLREVLMAVWRRQGWSLREMSYEHWDALATLAEPSPRRRAQTFPGGITAEISDGIVQLRRNTKTPT